MEAENQGNESGGTAGETVGTSAVDTVNAPQADTPRVEQTPSPADREGRTAAPDVAGPDAGEPCLRCGQELSVIRINVDGNTLLMESCDGCDARRWQLAGERIDLQEALDQVGEHSGRRPKS